MTKFAAALPHWKDELLPHIVDHYAKVTPNAVFAEYPRSTISYDESFRPVTYKLLANAVDGLANWLHDSLGPSKQFEALAYFGPNDVRFPALVLGAVKAGYVMVMLSPRNSVEAQKSLCARLHCTTILSSDPMTPAAKALLAIPGFQHITVPSVNDLLDVQHSPYVYSKTYSEARYDPLFIIHTSGSTGFPKPLTYRHEGAARNINMFAAAPPENYVSQNHMYQGQRLVNMMPPFHGAGLVTLLFIGIPFGTTSIMPLPNEVATAQQMVQVLEHTTAKAALVVPSIAHEFAHNPDLLAKAANKLELLLYCGGDLPQITGDIITSKMLLRCQYGASEIGITPQIIPTSASAKDWKYVCFPPCMGITFQEAADNTSELVVQRKTEFESTQPSFVLFPEKQEYRSQDLFTRHPQIPDLWAWNARADDIIVFLNGEKTNPMSFEGYIVASNHNILTAIMVGAQRLQAALLLERVDNTRELTVDEETQLIETIWPTIQEANRSAPAHARVEKSMILIMKPHKPALRAGKGTIQRAATVAQYSQEIDKLYIDIDAVLDVNGEVDGVSQSELNIAEVVAVIKQMLPLDVTEEDQNFFGMGMDSLGALQLIRKLKNRFKMPQLSLAQVYNHPSIEALAASIVRERASHGQPETNGEQQHEKEVVKVVKEFREEVERQCQPKMNRVDGESRKVILTGSTGALGGHLLNELILNDQVAHVYCLNRRANARDIQRLPDGSDVKGNTRVSFMTVSFAEDKFGLPKETYTELLDNVTDIIHNAWPVNFNLSFDSFKPQLRGVLNLIKLASSTKLQSRTMFISSISSVMGRQRSTRLIEEKIYEDYSPSLENGYAESKWAAEIMYNEAAALGLDVAVARVGQIAGPVRLPGVWNPLEWFPSLILSSASMKMLPDSLGPIFNVVDFIPADVLAEILVGLSMARRSISGNCDGRSPIIWHLQNPRRIEWAMLVPEVVELIQSTTGEEVKVVAAQKWLSQVRMVLDEAMTSTAGTPEERASQMDGAVARVPAVKLLDFYASIMSDSGYEYGRLDLSQTVGDSSNLASLDAVNAAWMKKWLEEWNLQT